MKIDKTRMRGRNRVRFTQELFVEYNQGIIDPYYSLTRDEDYTDDQGRYIISLHRAYIAHDDPSEYNFGTYYFDGFDHWEKISKTAFIRDYIDAWRKELVLKIKAKAFSKLKESADNGNTDAAKFIVNADMSNGLPSTLKTKEVKRGRPSNTQTTSTMEEMSAREEKKLLAEDLKRITNGNLN